MIEPARQGEIMLITAADAMLTGPREPARDHVGGHPEARHHHVLLWRTTMKRRVSYGGVGRDSGCCSAVPLG